MINYMKWVVCICLLSATRVWAVDTAPTTVTAIDVSSAGIVSVTLESGLAEVDCANIITFDYAANTLGEVYYTILMTAKSTGQRVALGYVVVGSPSYCELTRVEVYP